MRKTIPILVFCVALFICTALYIKNQSYLQTDAIGKYEYTIINKQEQVEYQSGSKYKTKYFILFMDSTGNISKCRVEQKEYEQYKIGHIVRLNNKLQ